LSHRRLSAVWLLLIALDKTEFWFQLARVTAKWLDYINRPLSPVMPIDGNVADTCQLDPDCFLQIYEYGPFHIYNQLHLMTVGIAIVSLVVRDASSFDPPE
jgi:hypothetical protein